MERRTDVSLGVSVHVSCAPEEDFSDTFAQYYYHSRHIASPRPTPPHSPYPEVVLEVPSDSDSSRRTSQFSSSAMSGLSGRRRASHCGELASLTLLGVPTFRQRGDSLPGNSSLSTAGLIFRTVVGNIDDQQLYTLRNFQMKGKKVINRGDSVKSRSKTSLNSRRSRWDLFTPAIGLRSCFIFPAWSPALKSPPQPRKGSAGGGKILLLYSATDQSGHERLLIFTVE